MPKHWWLEEDETPPAQPESTQEDSGLAAIKKNAHHWRRLSRRAYLIAGLIVFIGILGLLWYEIQIGLPTFDQIENPKPELATRLVSTDGELIDQYYIKNRTTVHLRDVPPDLINALIATEDRDFYHHWGINLWGNVRALWTDVVTLSRHQGASTITQQLARNLYPRNLPQIKSPLRKMREIVSAIQIERTHTKKEILEMYLNVVYFGRGAYGIEAAAQVYFSKDVEKLTPAQSAYLVGILKGPENYDPEDDYDRALARRNTVIDNMVDAKYLVPDRAEKLKHEPLKVSSQQSYHGIAPHFAEMIRQELAKRPELNGYDLYRDGLVVYTTMNAAMQRAANRAVKEHISEYQKTEVDKRWNWKNHEVMLDSLVAKAIRNEPDYKLASSEPVRRKIYNNLRNKREFVDSVKAAELRIQCGLVCLDQATGQIVAMVGSSNYDATRYGLNHVTQIVRQPGSSFKPIVYASVFEKGYSPESMVSNDPISIPDGDHVWTPGNFEGDAPQGMYTIAYALKESINLCAIHAMLDMTSTQDVVRMAKRLGIRSNIPAYPSIALGTAEVNPLELTSAYSTFANDGVRATPYAIIRVEDHNGKVLFRSRPEFDNVLDPKIAHEMTSALIGVVEGGTGSRVRTVGFNYPAAGKTGTTQNYADAWFVGYTPLFTCGVWVGFDDKRVSFTSSNGQGGRAAAPIWGKFMKYSYEALKPHISHFETSYTPSTKYAPGQDSSGGRDTNALPYIPPVKNAPAAPVSQDPGTPILQSMKPSRSPGKSR